MDPEKLAREELLEVQLLESEAMRIDAEINLLVFKSGLGKMRGEAANKLKAARSALVEKYGLSDGDGWDAEGVVTRKQLKAV